jgi:uncharacterized protein YdgA (DUF945 family)
MIRKILSVLMILTLLVLFGATYFSSTKTEAAFRQQIEQLNRTYAGMLGVELLEYQRGWLLSKVKTRLVLKQQAWELQHQIRHFPWKVQMFTGFAPDSGVAEELAKKLPLDQVQLQTDVALDGSSQNRFNLPELRFSDQRIEFLLQGLSCEFDLEREMRGGQLLFYLDSLQVSEPGVAELVLADLEIDSRFTDVQGLPLGGGKVLIGELSLIQGEAAGIVLNELLYQVDSRLENDQLSSAIDLQLQRLQLGGESFTDGKLVLQISGIDAATVRELQDSIRQLQVELQGEQIDPLIIQLQLLGLYTQLFQEGVTISLPQLTLQADNGALTGAGEVLLQQLNLAGGGMAFDNISANLQLNVELPIFQAGFRVYNFLQDMPGNDNRAVLNEQAEQLAGALVQKGIFVRVDGGYRADFSLKQGQAELNGQPFRLRF